MKRKLIEVALPLEVINVASAHEGSIYRGNPSAVHKWWAQRPLAACRAVLFATLVDDPSSDPVLFPTPNAVEDERSRLFAIIDRLVQWENTTNQTVLEEARVEIRRSTGGNPPPVLDPFCGAGSIPLEAQRLGLTAYASDLNPVAALITKALIEIPPKFANHPPTHPDARRGVGGSGTWKGASGLAEDIRRYGSWMRDEAERRIGHLYPKVKLPKGHGGGEATVMAWLWAHTVICPNPGCGARAPLIRSWNISTRKGKERWVEPIVDRAERTVAFKIRVGQSPRADGTVGRLGARCIVCDAPLSFEHVRREGTAGRMGAALMAIVADSQVGRIYLAATDEHRRIAESAQPAWAPETDLPDQALGFRVQAYGMTRHRDLFTARQLVALTTLSDLVADTRRRVVMDAREAGLPDDGISLADGGVSASAYADAIAIYAAFAVDKTAENSCVLAVWYPKEDRPKGVFARQSLAMVWDFPEVNPLGDIGGTFAASCRIVSDAIESLPAGPPAWVSQQDAAGLTSATSSAVCTDPPYYDNIGYADLSDFFYVWLRRSLAGIAPGLFGTVLTPKDAEMIASPFRFGGSRSKARHHFETGLDAAFTRIREVADPEIPVTLFYAFKQSESEDNSVGGLTTASTGWETMLEGLLRAGFSVVGTWPMRTERTTRSISLGTNALASSILLVCRPRFAQAGITTRKDFVSALKRELPVALRTLQRGNIAPVDLAQASIGPGMGIFSGYAKVLEPDGSTMPVRAALALINQVLDEILTEQEGEFDADTRWAITWYEQFGLNEAAYGTAETLSKAKNTSVGGLQEAGVVAASHSRVRLLGRAEYQPDWDPETDRRLPVWEATQRLVQVLLTGGEPPAGELLARLGGLGDTARDLAYRLFQLAERKGWTDEARAYNALVVAWPDLVRRAEQVRRGRPAQASLGLET